MGHIPIVACASISLCLSLCFPHSLPLSLCPSVSLSLSASPCTPPLSMSVSLLAVQLRAEGPESCELQLCCLYSPRKGAGAPIPAPKGVTHTQNVWPAVHRPTVQKASILPLFLIQAMAACSSPKRTLPPSLIPAAWEPHHLHSPAESALSVTRHPPFPKDQGPEGLSGPSTSVSHTV